jgi:hypothetical protein
MTLSVRLPPEIDEQFALVCRRRHVTKAEAITRLVRDFIAAHPQHSSYDVAEKLGIVGAAVDEPEDLSAAVKVRIGRTLRAKHHR